MAASLGVEHARRAGDRRFLQAGDLGDAAFGCQVALRMARWPCAYIGLAHRRITSWSARGASGSVGQLLGRASCR